MAASRPPSVDVVIRALRDLDAPRALAVETARSVVENVRHRMLGGEQIDAVTTAREELTRALQNRPHSLINATGVLLHTNLGRAPLHQVAAQEAAALAQQYTNLEFDVSLGTRGSRAVYVERLLTGLSGAEAALVVNNNAGALFLTLSCLAKGKKVPVSRGELIEIGGSYRLPELMAASGAALVEVGTTNRTRIADYRSAAGEDTALLLKVHPSNYTVVGFSEEASLGELAALGRERDLPLVYDVGSGLLDEEVPWLTGPPPSWIRGEPGVRQALQTGADLVLFSGDKLLGGPQAGIVVGRGDLVRSLRSHPIARALRTDGATLAALVVTLELYANGKGSEVPLWRLATLGYEELEARSRRVVEDSECPADLIESESLLGAGSVPGRGIPTPVIALDPVDPDGAWRRLLEEGVVARREAGRIILDLRAVSDHQDQTVIAALRRACLS